MDPEQTTGPLSGGKMRGLVLVIAMILGASIARADIEWNGFGSAFLGIAGNKNFLPKGFNNTSPQFGAFSLMGLNVGSNVGENLRFAAQLVAQDTDGTGAWTTNARWAFLRADVNGLNIKLGRQLLPALIGSEFASVHYLLPYHQIPVQMSTLVSSSQFDGLTLGHKFVVGSNTLNFSIFGGSPILDPIPSPGLSIIGSTRDLFGANALFSGDGYQIQAAAFRQAAQYQIYTIAGGATPSLDLSGAQFIYTLGYRYDRGGFVSWGEWGQMRSDNGNTVASTGRVFNKDNTSGYVLIGHHFGPWMPRYTFATTTGQLGYQADHSEQAHTLGVNYKINDQAIAKLEYEMTTLPDADHKGPGTAVRPTAPAAGSDAKNGNAVYAGVDFVF